MELVRKLSWRSNDIRLIGPTTKLLGAGTVINYSLTELGLLNVRKENRGDIKTAPCQGLLQRGKRWTSASSGWTGAGGAGSTSVTRF